MPAEGQGVRRQLHCPRWGVCSRSTASPAWTDTDQSLFLPCFTIFSPVPALFCPFPAIWFPVPASKTSRVLRSQQCQVPPGWRNIFLYTVSLGRINYPGNKPPKVPYESPWRWQPSSRTAGLLPPALAVPTRHDATCAMAQHHGAGCCTLLKDDNTKLQPCLLNQSFSGKNPHCLAWRLPEFCLAPIMTRRA